MRPFDPRVSLPRQPADYLPRSPLADVVDRLTLGRREQAQRRKPGNLRDTYIELDFDLNRDPDPRSGFRPRLCPYLELDLDRIRPELASGLGSEIESRLWH